MYLFFNVYYNSTTNKALLCFAFGRTVLSTVHVPGGGVGAAAAHAADTATRRPGARDAISILIVRMKLYKGHLFVGTEDALVNANEQL
jgi:F0F1-type ATP synthase membrane subunit c/vacuolar-type H+-ATPase subunit K